MADQRLYGRILLGYDGTEPSRDALALARLLASGGTRTVVVGHVIPQPKPYDSRTREYVMLVREHDHAVLEPALAELAGLTVESHPIESASAARGLHELVEEEGASLIVIGSTHRGPVGRVVIGSVGEVLLAGTPAAVAVAPKGFAQALPDAIRTVSVGFKHPAEDHSALHAAAALAADLGARLRVIAVEETFLRARHTRDTRSHRGPALADDLARALADAQTPDAEQVVMTGAVATCLARACADSDLLVIGSRSYGPLHHTLLGSVSAKLMRSCPAPLLVVPRGAGAPARPAARSGEPSRAGG